jgi:hypothetical protein
VFEVCIINQTKVCDRAQQGVGFGADRERNRSAFKKSSFVKKGAVKDVDKITINGGSDKPTELGCVQGGFISPSSEVKVGHEG